MWRLFTLITVRIPCGLYRGSDLKYSHGPGPKIRTKKVSYVYYARLILLACVLYGLRSNAVVCLSRKTENSVS